MEVDAHTLTRSRGSCEHLHLWKLPATVCTSLISSIRPMRKREGAALVIQVDGEYKGVLL